MEEVERLAINVTAEVRKEKSRLMQQYDILDGKYENGSLVEEEEEVMKCTLAKLEDF